MEKNKIILLLEILFIACFALFIGSAQIVNPFFGDINMIDEGQFGAWANHMLLGKSMFRDIYITYGPLYVYPLYLLFKFFGPSAFLVRLYLTLGSIIGILSALLLVYKLGLSRRVRWFGIAMLCLIPGLSLRQGLGFLVIYTLIKSFESRILLWGFVTGILLSLCFLISPDIGIFSFLIVGIALFYKSLSTKHLRRYILHTLVVIAGLMSVFILFGVWSVKEGWFIHYVTTTIDAFTSFSGINLPNGQNFPNPIQLFPRDLNILLWMRFILSKDMLLYWGIIAYIVTSFYILLSIILKKDMQSLLPISLISIYGFLLFYILLGRSGHFFFALPPIFILSFYFMDTLIETYKNRKHVIEEQVIIISGIVLILLFSLRLVSIFRPHFHNLTTFSSYITLKKDNPRYIGPITISKSQKEYIGLIQNFINSNTENKDDVFFFGNEPMMYLLVQRTNPTRFDLPYIANTKEKRLEVVSDIVNKKPQYIIYNTEAWSVDDVNNRQRLPEVVSFIDMQYKVRERIGNTIIYEAK